VPTKDKINPRLQNLDALFNLNDGINPLEKPTPIMDTQPQYKRVVTSVAVEMLMPFKGHPFQLYEGERLNDLVASIKANGVLVPIIARKVGAIIEILAGHNRVNGAKMAELTEVPVIIVENISDEDAMVYVIETNLIQRSFADMVHSEKAAVIALHHSKMFSQGKRNDIRNQIEMLEKPHEYGENSTRGQVVQRFNSREITAQDYNLSSKTVARYLRINQLVTVLKSMLDKGNIAFIPAVTVSYLKEAEQLLLADYLVNRGFSVDMKKADTLRKYSEKAALNNDNINRILSGGVDHKPNRTPTVKINKELYSKYFKSNQSAKEVQCIVEKALKMYFSH